VNATARRLAIALLAACALTALAAAPAWAVPANFWGAVPQRQLNSSQLQRLRQGGVDSVRVPLVWAAVQAGPGAKLDFSGFDPLVAAAARAHVELLPFLYGAPQWAVRQGAVPGTGGGAKAPVHLPASGAAGRGWSEFARGAVARYGPQGSFWAENPSVPRRPIRTWQIWNEENYKYFVVRPNPGEYGQLVKRSAAAIRAADRGATIVLGGLFARPAEAALPLHPPQAYTAVEFLDQMYRRSPGVNAAFDGVALHPYTSSYRNLESEIIEARRVLGRHGGAGKGLWLTEIGWSSQRPSRGDAFAKGVQGQARELTGAFRVLRANQARWRLRQVFWFSVDDLPGACNFCGGSGLFGPGFKPKPAWRAYVRFAGGRAG
jgi:hypothetical protein